MSLTNAPMIRLSSGRLVVLLALAAFCATACVSRPPSPPLHQDIKDGKIDALRTAIENGASLVDRNARGLTPLHLALTLERREMAIELIQRGADINARTQNGLTPLGLAIDKGYADVVDLLLARHVVVDPLAGASPLFSAIRANNRTIFESLVASGAQVNRRNSDDETLLYVASGLGQATLVERLLELGADSNAALPDGRTSLHVALMNSHEPVANLLYSRGAGVSAAEGEVGVFTTALVYRFAAQKEYEKRNTARALQYLQLAKSSFVAAHSLTDDRARNFANKVVKIRVLNVLALALGQAQANAVAQSSIAGVGTSIVPLGSTSSDVVLRDSYRGVAKFCEGEVQRMATIDTCVATDAGATRACFASPAK